MKSVLFVCCGAIALMSPAAVGQTLSFTDLSSASGLDSIPHSRLGGGPDMEFMNAGGAVADFNGNGLPDIFVIGGSSGVDQLWWNNGDGTFTEGAAAAGLVFTHAGSGAAAGDYNKDGHIDLYVTSLGPGPGGFAAGWNRLYRNNGDGTFTNVTAAAGVAETNPWTGDSYGAAFGDYDLDGDLDLAVAGWLGGNVLFRNNGDGTFTDVTATAINIDLSGVRGFAPRFTDINNDRYPELLWVADFRTSKYLVNNGDGTFTDQTVASGTGLDSNGMGNAQGDVNNDGDIDWYVTSKIASDGSHGPGSSGNMLYMCAGDDTFSEESIPRGCNFGHWGWGATIVDFDHDGWQDIIHTNGWQAPNYHEDPTYLFMNNGDGSFTESAAAFGITDTKQGRGLLHLDMDGDGDMDVVIFNNHQPLVVIRNDLSGTDANWLKIILDPPLCSGLAPNGFGTRVELTAGGMTQVRYLDGGSNYLATSELVVHFGLGQETTIESLIVRWADGRTSQLNGISANRTLVLSPCPPDINRDCSVDTADLGQLIGALGDVGLELISDLNADGIVDTADLGLLISSFGTTCD